MYNENDPHAAHWLKNLIDHGHIMRGRVDDRSIVELRASDIRDNTQCHFFAGIGVWSHALRLAGWNDSRPVWTGSCPCQPFSGAGKRKGISDARHLWPAWFDLIRECKPPTILGEQVASKAAFGWFDAVSADLESEGYAVAAADLCAASVGAPHIRQRLFWMAHAAQQQRDGCRDSGKGWRVEPANGCGTGSGLENTTGLRQPRVGRERQNGIAEPSSEYAGSRLVNAASERHGPHDVEPLTGWRECATGSTDGPFAELEWIECSDGKYRSTQSGIFPLAHGVAGRVAKLRAIGNAIVAPLAVEFIKTVMEITP